MTIRNDLDPSNNSYFEWMEQAKKKRSQSQINNAQSQDDNSSITSITSILKQKKLDIELEEKNTAFISQMILHLLKGKNIMVTGPSGSGITKNITMLQKLLNAMNNDFSELFKLLPEDYQHVYVGSACTSGNFHLVGADNDFLLSTQSLEHPGKFQLLQDALKAKPDKHILLFLDKLFESGYAKKDITSFLHMLKSNVLDYFTNISVIFAGKHEDYIAVNGIIGDIQELAIPGLSQEEMFDYFTKKNNEYLSQYALQEEYSAKEIMGSESIKETTYSDEFIRVLHETFLATLTQKIVSNTQANKSVSSYTFKQVNNFVEEFDSYLINKNIFLTDVITMSIEDFTHMCNDFLSTSYNINKKVFSKNVIKETIKTITQKVIGQDEHIKQTVSSIFLSKVLGKQPTGVFMFLGPTGVGKTETAKQLAEHLYGDKSKLLLLPMNEYRHDVDVYGLTGSKPGFVGFDETETLAEKLAKIGEGVVIFDEIEKAHPLFSQFILKGIEEGYIEMGNGKYADLSNFTLIFTSNLIQSVGELSHNTRKIGFDANNEEKELSKEQEKLLNIKKRELIINALKQHFKPEFLGRFDNLCIFNELNEKQLMKILENKFASIKNKLFSDYEKGIIESSVLTKSDIETLTKMKKGEKELIVKEAIALKLGGRYIEKKLNEYISRKFEELLLD